MQRTQVYFDEEILRILKEEARKQKTTLASVIRGKVEKNIKKKRKLIKAKKMGTVEFLLGIAKLGEKIKVNGSSDLSQKIDEYVYK